MEAPAPSEPPAARPRAGVGGEDPHCGLGLHSTQPGGQRRAPRDVTYLGQVGGLGEPEMGRVGGLGEPETGRVGGPGLLGSLSPSSL